MSRYLNNAALLDLILSVSLLALLSIFQNHFSFLINSVESIKLSAAIVSLISVTSTAIGFLLTIVTVIATFKNSYDSNAKMHVPEESNNEGPKSPDRPLDKTKILFDTPLTGYVIRVFFWAAMELVIALVCLLSLQLDLFSMSIYLKTSSVFILSLIIISCATRSFSVFWLFLKAVANNH